MKLLKRLIPAFLFICLPACVSIQDEGTIPPPSGSGSAQEARTSPTFTITFSGISALPIITPANPTPTSQGFAKPTALSQPMQLFFPTIIPAEGAEYRPPLYPVPWALMPNDHFYFSAPIAANYPGDPVSDYLYGGIYFGPDVIHSGIDIPAPRGAEVLAAGPGIVVWAGVGLFSGSTYNTNDPYGKAVAIRHDFGYRDQELYTVYAHMEEVDVVVGQRVKTGDVVGHVGDTGMTTGPHLHFEVRLGANDFWKTRNPELWISPPQGYGVLVGRVTTTYGQRLDTYLVMLKSLATNQNYVTKTYGPLTVNCDDYYNENVVLGNLPAGIYELNIPYGALNRITNVQILPGQITYFSFHGFNGYDFTLPTTQDTETP